MDKAVIAAKEPAVLDLDAGTYHFCACGRSSSQPFCDGSHEGTGFEPLEFELKERQTVALCQCKQSKNKPFCDGTHLTL